VYLLSQSHWESANYGRPTKELKTARTINASTLSGLNVLIADDAPDNRLLVQRFLTLAGAKVDMGHDGHEAIQMALQGNYETVFMDIQMPRVDGFQATATLRSLGLTIPIIAMTAHAMRSDVERCLSMGYSDQLAKPFGFSEIIEKLLHVLTTRNRFDQPSTPLH
jgi:CheY-like chemotaxis protein